jgi:hypothetical protein
MKLAKIRRQMGLSFFSSDLMGVKEHMFQVLTLSGRDVVEKII